MPHLGETEAMSLTKADGPFPILFSRSPWHIVSCNLQMKIKKKITLPVKVVTESKLILLFIFRGQLDAIFLFSHDVVYFLRGNSQCTGLTLLLIFNYFQFR